ncbi:MAG: elongation factor G, partial [Desulfobacula sp.]|nr:elongation factor G [Desulfobacula sp.]
EPCEEEFEFTNKITGGRIPTQYIPACEKGFQGCMNKGPKLEFPVTGIKVTIDDGAFHAVDSSEMAFQSAARGAFLEAYVKAKPVIKEPIMKVVIETPNEFQGGCMGLINQRRGIIQGSQEEGVMSVIESQVPLSDMFGFSTVLRSATQGKAQFTMEFSTYKKVPQSIAEEIARKKQEEKNNN